MEVTYKSGNGQFVVTFDTKDASSLFEDIANFQEVFEDGNLIINGKSVPNEHVQFKVREVDGNKYFEKAYIGPDKELWGYKLQFGQNKKGGGLFPKRFLDDEDKKNYEDGGFGWRKWKKQANTAPTNAANDKKSRSSEDAPF